MIVRLLEKVLFASRWLLAPFYLALVLGLVDLLVKAGQHIWEIAQHIVSATESEAILDLLGLIDLSLIASLVVLVIFSGYKNFVAHLDPAARNWPDWMSKIDFTGLKLKLVSTIVAISAIQLLRAFMDIPDISDRDLTWYVVIHLVFVVSGLLMALTDRVSGGYGSPEGDKV